jgi:hypothetical protein
LARRRLLLRMLLLLLLLLPPLLLFFLRHVMPYRAAGRGAQDSVMTGDVPGDAPNDSSFEATLRLRTLRSDKKREAQDQCLHLRHTVTPLSAQRVTGL